MSDFGRFVGSIRYADPDLMAIAVSVAQKMEQERDQWIARLRAIGVKAAHPDDGWVDRQKNTVRLQYPQFDDGLRIGDLLALGWPGAKTRIVRVTGAAPVALCRRHLWAFEVTPE